MTTVLALDQASRTGFAVFSDLGIVMAGSWNLDDGIQKSGKRAVPVDVQHVLKIRRLRSEITRVIRAYGVDVVACEREFGRGSGQRLLVSLYTAVQEAALDENLPCLGVRIADWRREMHGSAGGSGEAQKQKAIEACASLGWVLDEDAAEAVQIARYVHKTMRVSPPAPAPRGVAA